MRFLIFIALTSVFFVVCFSTPVPTENVAKSNAEAEVQLTGSGDSKVDAQATAKSETIGSGNGDTQVKAETETKAKSSTKQTGAEATAQASASATVQDDDCKECGGKIIKPENLKCSSCSVLQYNAEILNSMIGRSYYFYQGTTANSEVDFDVPFCSDLYISKKCKTVKMTFEKKSEEILTKKVWGSDGSSFMYMETETKVVSHEYISLQDSIKNVMVIPQGSEQLQQPAKMDALTQALSCDEYLVLAACDKYVILRTHTESEAQVFIGVSQEIYESANIQEEITASIAQVLQRNSMDTSNYMTLKDKFVKDTKSFSATASASASVSVSDKTSDQNNSTVQENNQFENESGKTETKASAEATAKSQTGVTAGSQTSATASADASVVCGGEVIKSKNCKCSACSVMRYNEDILAEAMKETWFLYQGTQVKKEVPLDVTACSDWHLANGCKAVKIQFVKKGDTIVKKVWGTTGNAYSYFQSDVTVVSQESITLKDELRNVMVVPEGAQKAIAAEKKKEFIQAENGIEYVLLAAVKDEYIIMRTNADADAEVFIGLRQNWYEKDNKDEIIKKINKVLELNSMDVSSLITLTEKFNVDTNTFGSRETSKKETEETEINSSGQQVIKKKVEDKTCAEDGSGNSASGTSSATSETTNGKSGDQTKAEATAVSKVDNNNTGDQNKVAAGAEATAVSKVDNNNTGDQNKAAAGAEATAASKIDNNNTGDQNKVGAGALANASSETTQGTGTNVTAEADAEAKTKATGDGSSATAQAESQASVQGK